MYSHTGGEVFVCKTHHIQFEIRGTCKTTITHCPLFKSQIKNFKLKNYGAIKEVNIDFKKGDDENA